MPRWTEDDAADIISRTLDQPSRPAIDRRDHFPFTRMHVAPARTAGPPLGTDPYHDADRTTWPHPVGPACHTGTFADLEPNTVPVGSFLDDAAALGAYASRIAAQAVAPIHEPVAFAPEIAPRTPRAMRYRKRCAKCGSKRRTWTGRTAVQLDGRGQIIDATAKLIYQCCSCGKETPSWR